ncbi:hypothetical protein GALMADRAFT_143382 [Galerina marginata CBS 339.88]|uniref:Uncharacterized protein n=1 Tax=Galerina marginata (strain CBS 339.88) TaxID=685588 RepID=A0A067SMC3_GALM3|nr:hypothetical protein GALMADRAFT_143382 [Galerina marginata CBS 339.88]
MSHNSPEIGLSNNYSEHSEVDNLTDSIKSLGFGGFDDLRQYKTAKFNVTLSPIVLEKDHAERVSKRTTFGLNNQLPEDHPLYSLPKAVAPSTSDFSFSKEEICSLPSPSASVLLAPSPVPPPANSWYPLAPLGGYKLVKDLRYKRGYVYVASYDMSPTNIKGHAASLAKIATPPNVDPAFIDGAFVASPIPGMIKMVPGVPFALAFNGDMERLHTVGCVQTLESLSAYPDFPEILNLSARLAKLT